MQFLFITYVGNGEKIFVLNRNEFSTCQSTTQKLSLKTTADDTDINIRV